MILVVLRTFFIVYESIKIANATAKKNSELWKLQLVKMMNMEAWRSHFILSIYIIILRLLNPKQSENK